MHKSLRRRIPVVSLSAQSDSSHEAINKKRPLRLSSRIAPQWSRIHEAKGRIGISRVRLDVGTAADGVELLRRAES
jgi:hypothetical protein